MQGKKNLRFIIIFLILLIWTFVFINLRESNTRISVDEEKFAITDTAAIANICIENPYGKQVILDKNSGSWMVNETYFLDPSMKAVLFAVLHQVRVKRTVPKNRLDEITEDLKKNGYQVTVQMDNGLKSSFTAGGNGISISYFKYTGEDPLIVFLPGYESYVSGIFEVTLNDWRDRLIFQTSWLGLKRLSLTYPTNPSDNIVIEPAENLYRVENISKLDTNAVMNFIDQISFFYTDQFIDRGQIYAYDSLIDTEPSAILFLEAVGLEEEISIKFYESLPNENVRLGVINDSIMCLFANQRIAFLFKQRHDFYLNPN